MDYKTYASIYGSDLYITEPERRQNLKSIIGEAAMKNTVSTKVKNIT